MQALIYFQTHLCLCCMHYYTHTIHINMTVNFEDYFVNILNFKQMLFKSKDFFFSHNVSIKHYLGLSRIVTAPFLTKFSPLMLPSSKCERGKDLLIARKTV